MESQTFDPAKIFEAIEGLRSELTRLRDRLDAIENKAAGPIAAATHSSPAVHSNEALSEELVLTISAAIAAYLGVKPHIRHIRVLGSASWGQQGRATIQASHSLNVVHN